MYHQIRTAHHEKYFDSGQIRRCVWFHTCIVICSLIYIISLWLAGSKNASQDSQFYQDSVKHHKHYYKIVTAQ